MKKFMIIGLTLFAFAFVGCKDKDEPAEPAEPAVEKPAEPAVTPPVEVAVYTVTNKLEAAATVVSGTNSQTLAKEGCVKVKADSFASLKVSVGDEVLCDSTDKNTDDTAKTENDCAAANSDIMAKTGDGASGNELKAATVANAATTCVDLVVPATTIQ